MRVARTTSRPPTFVVAPVTESPSATSTGTASPVSMDASTADVPETTMLFGGDLLARSHDELVADLQVFDGDLRLDAARAERRPPSLEFEESAQGGTRLLLGALLEVAPGEG